MKHLKQFLVLITDAKLIVGEMGCGEFTIILTRQYMFWNTVNPPKIDAIMIIILRLWEFPAFSQNLYLRASGMKDFVHGKRVTLWWIWSAKTLQWEKLCMTLQSILKGSLHVTKFNFRHVTFSSRLWQYHIYTQNHVVHYTQWEKLVFFRVPLCNFGGLCLHISHFYRCFFCISGALSCILGALLCILEALFAF